MYRELSRAWARGARGSLGRGSPAAVLGASLALVCASTALAAGKAVNIATPFDSGPPAMAVDSAGNAVIAWANTRDLPPVTTNIVQYCVLPVGATGCAHSGNLTPADSAEFIDGVQVRNEGGTLVILADVYGAAGNNARDFEPEQEWQSTDGGATFGIVNGGRSVTSANISADTAPLGAVTLPGAGVLGYGWNTAGREPPTFNAFPLASPPECSKAVCANGFASLQPSTNPDQISNAGGQFASELGAHPGVMGIFNTLFTNGPLGCAQSFGTAFAYGSGLQSATNNYNVSPGQANSAWKVPVTQAACDVEYPAVGGGPSGFGLLEAELGSNTTVYQRFDQATQKFDRPLVTVAGQGEQSPAVSQDGAGGVYATYLLSGSGGPIALSYSADGGGSWTGGILNPDKNRGANNLSSSVNPAGQGWATWVDNGSVFAQSFQAADAVNAASIGGATSNGKTVTVNVICTSFPCTITITLTAPETVVVHAAAARAAATKHKRKTITLGTGKVTIKHKGSKKLTVRLTRAGKRFLSSRKGHIKITGKITETVQHHKLVYSRTLKLTIKKKK